jgi:hypothetical protein
MRFTYRSRFIKYLQRLPPCPLLAVIDLSQEQNLPLHYLP